MYNFISIFGVLIATLPLIVIGESTVKYADGVTINDIDSYLKEYLSGAPELALLLDYDGTLANITSHPNTTSMSSVTREILQKIADNERIFVAVISGRGVDNVRDKVGIDNIVYSGNHGLEIYFPNGSRYNHEIPNEIGGKYSQLMKALNEAVATENAWIEDKKVSLTFHYRQAPEHLKTDMRERAIAIINSFGYRSNQAHEAIEAKPPLDWNKGSVAQHILKLKYGENWYDNVKTVFAGDDTTDEDIMKLLRGKGVSFRVTNDPNIDSFATHKIPSTYSLYMILKWINDLYTQ